MQATSSQAEMVERHEPRLGFPKLVWLDQIPSLVKITPHPPFICLGMNPASATQNSRALLELVDKGRALHVPPQHPHGGTLLSESFWPISDWTM